MSERKIEREIEIDATPEEVWRAISEGEELKRWFPLDARVTPGPGGKVWLSWGEGSDWESPIEIWEPSRHLRTVDVTPGKEGAPPTRIAVDYLIETRGGKTILRLIHSGFSSDTWQDEMDSLDAGWSAFLVNLKLYLERHRGEPRQLAFFRHPAVAMERAEAFRRTLAVLGLDAPEELQPGVAFQGTTRGGDRLEGTARIVKRPVNFSAIVRNWNDAFLIVEIEPGRKRCRPAIWLSLYGKARADAARMSKSIQELLTNEFAKSTATEE